MKGLSILFFNFLFGNRERGALTKKKEFDITLFGWQERLKERPEKHTGSSKGREDERRPSA